MTHRVDAALVGDLLIGEISRWEVGVCTVRCRQGTLTVTGEGGHRLLSLRDRDMPRRKTGQIDLSAVAERVNQATRQEQEAL